MNLKLSNIKKKENNKLNGLDHHRLRLLGHHFSHNILLRDLGRVVENGTSVFLFVAALAAPDAAENATSDDGSHNHADDQERNPQAGEPGIRVPCAE